MVKAVFFRTILVGMSVLASLLLMNAFLIWSGYTNREFVWGWANGITEENNFNKRIFSLDPELIYVPNQDVYLGKKVMTDEDGFRPTGTPLSEADALTIVTLGDSFTWGHLLENDQTYPYFLELELRQKGIPVNVKNAGVNGYGSDQQFLYFRDRILERANPDIVLWNINSNDIEENNFACLFVPSQDTFKQVSAVRNTSYLQGFFAKILPPSVRKTPVANMALSSLAPGWDRRTIGCRRNTQTSAFLSQEQEKKLQFFLSEMNELSKQYDFLFVVSLVPNQHYTYRFSQGDPQWITLYEELSQILSSGDFPFINLGKGIEPYLGDVESEETEGSEDYSPAHVSLEDFFIDEGKDAWGHWHLTEKGNRVIGFLSAEEIYKLLPLSIPQ